jgi:hypothetical protein
MRISYAITVCNEFIEIQRLLKFLLENKRTQDEIVILYDGSNGDAEIESACISEKISDIVKNRKKSNDIEEEEESTWYHIQAEEENGSRKRR